MRTKPGRRDEVVALLLRDVESFVRPEIPRRQSGNT
jgi:hypothetical protein